MNEFSELVFPAEIARKSEGGPEFFTSIALNAAGKESRNLNWQHARMKYNINLEKLSADEITTVINFFYIHRGSAVGFRFKDWSDYQAQNQQLHPLEPEQPTKFQLTKLYQIEQSQYLRTIRKPIAASVHLAIQGTQLTSEAFSIDYSTGIVTLAEPLTPDAILTASYEFEVPVRFMHDHLKLEFNQNIDIPNIELIEIK